MLGAFWLPPLNREGIIQRGAANIAETWSLIGRALLPGSGGARGGKEL